MSGGECLRQLMATEIATAPARLFLSFRVTWELQETGWLFGKDPKTTSQHSSAVFVSPESLRFSAIYLGHLKWAFFFLTLVKR